MARHRLFIIAADIKQGCEDDLRRLDPAFRAPGEAVPGALLRSPNFSQLAMLHYASFVVFDKDRLDTPRSKLVLECNIDGSQDRFLDALIGDPALDGIYRCCEDYPVGGNTQAKRAYLTDRDRLRRPQLFHIGAPNRSVSSIKTDRDLRRQLDADLDGLMAPSLTDYSGGKLPGVREVGTWDAISPWAAWIVGILGPLLLVWFAIFVAQSTLPRVTRVMSMVFCAVVVVIIIVAAFKMWIGVVPELRDRAWPWVRWTLLGVAVSIAAWRLWPAHQRWALGLVALLAMGIVYAAYTLARRKANERLRLIRANTSGPSVAAIWKALRRQAPPGDRREWAQRILNWSIWLVAYGVLYVPILWMAPHRWLVVMVLTVLFLLKGLWLSVLLGWPANDGRIKQDYKRIIAFIIGLPAVAFASFLILTGLRLGQYPSVLSLIVLIALFSVWAVPLPSPDVRYVPVDREELGRIMSAEDHGATNHMSAVVVLNQQGRYRLPVLKSFLWLLNHLYFRVLLPDVYRGKLWGIPTVHFAQWVMLDARNFLFLSNYDDSWTSYLDDFGVQLTTGIQKIWGQGIANPGTKDLGRFKEYARATMVRHSLWYRAYPGITVRQVWNNEQIRRAIATARDEDAMMRALRRFGAATKVLPGIFHGRSI